MRSPTFDDVIGKLGGRPRPGQQQMADTVTDAIAGAGKAAVLAGTGVGKSYGYLVPLALSHKRAVIATGTIGLQEQLVGQDLPRLQEIIGEQFTFALYKGVTNYVCPAALAELEGSMVPDLEGAAELVAWARAGGADKADLDVEPSRSAWNLVSCASGECLGDMCSYRAQCPAMAAKAIALEAQVVVTNHSMMAVAVANGVALFGEDREVIVVDEAHALPERVASELGANLHPGRLHNLRRRADLALRKYGHIDAVRDVALQTTRLRDLGEHLGLVLAEVPMGPPIVPADHPALAAALFDIAVECTAAAAACAGVAVWCEGSDDDDEIRAGTAFERLGEGFLAVTLDVAKTSVVGAGVACWVEKRGLDGAALVSINLADTPAALANWWADRATIACSATLPKGFTAAAGLGADVVRASVASPFNYRRQAVLLVPEDAMRPTAGRADDPWRPWAAETAAQLIMAAGGRTLVLSPSADERDYFAAQLRLALPTEIPVIVQGEVTKRAAIDAKKADPAAVVVATRGFFEGVDIPGAALQLVIVTRLPFASPRDPVQIAREDLARAAGCGDTFGKVALPQMWLALQQAVGRLIRSETDRGIVAILDERAQHRGYVPAGILPDFARGSGGQPYTTGCVAAMLRRLTSATAG